MEVLMSLFKLAIYGGIGYLVYQAFFTDMPRSGTARGGSRQSSGRGGSSRQGGGREGGQQMSGSREGMSVATEEPSGASTRHQVGRGVVS
jgi:hypothetical protein